MLDSALPATAVLVAAGTGTRLGAGGPKALAELAGRPLVAWSLDALRAAGAIGPIIVAAPPDHVDELGALAPSARVVAGGETRSQSVREALALVETDLVVVHDAARPLAPAALFDDIVRALAADRQADALIAAAPVADTIKRAGADRVVAQTLTRDGLWAVQTPQAFRTEALRAALAVPAGALAAATDDAMLVEAGGGTVRVLGAPWPNPKVTTPADLRLAEALLAAR